MSSRAIFKNVQVSFNNVGLRIEAKNDRGGKIAMEALLTDVVSCYLKYYLNLAKRSEVPEFQFHQIDDNVFIKAGFVKKLEHITVLAGLFFKEVMG